MENWNEITVDIATMLTFIATVYVTIGHKYYSFPTIFILWFMSITSFTWENMLPLWVNDMMYDFVFIFIAIYLVSNTKCHCHIKERDEYIQKIKQKIKGCCDTPE